MKYARLSGIHLFTPYVNIRFRIIKITLWALLKVDYLSIGLDDVYILHLLRKVNIKIKQKN